MDYLDQLRRQISNKLFISLLLENILLISGGWALASYTHLQLWLISALILGIGLILALVLARSSAKLATEPIAAIRQSVLHISPTEHGTSAPSIERLRVGRELVTNLTAQIYQLTSIATHDNDLVRSAAQDLNQNFIANNLPLPCIVLDATETIVFANHTAAEYIGQPASELLGKNIYMVLDMSFPSEDTFDAWLKNAKVHSATATCSWERVRLNVRENHPTLLFDLAAYYNKNNPQQNETMLILFDHTKQYSQDEQAVSFIALSVHELRTPLTLLRGYIEVFEDELTESLSPELQDFMLKMRATAEQLTAFVNNILNVARIDDDQLQLNLQEEAWGPIINRALEGLRLRAKVRGISLECTIEEGLPAVGVDPLSIQEVINNLLDNAIKYSGTSKVIKINAHLTSDGFVETTVQDYGLGISSSIMPNLFTKFYRDHRNRAQIGGTGLGLYLSKSIVTAHGGNMWVSSHENEGSTFAFTLIPYDQLAKELKKSGDQHITRSAHGWIKNHSLYRR